MFLKEKSTGNLVELMTLDNLYDPCQDTIAGRVHAGEEMQDLETFLKSDMIFPSGEPLPLCWLNPRYQEIIREKSKLAAV